MSRRITHVALAVIATVGLAMPASAQSQRERQMMADIRMLQEQTQQFQQEQQQALIPVFCPKALRLLDQRRLQDQGGCH